MIISLYFCLFYCFFSHESVNWKWKFQQIAFICMFISDQEQKINYTPHIEIEIGHCIWIRHINSILQYLLE